MKNSHSFDLNKPAILLNYTRCLIELEREKMILTTADQANNFALWLLDSKDYERIGFESTLELLDWLKRDIRMVFGEHTFTERELTVIVEVAYAAWPGEIEFATDEEV